MSICFPKLIFGQKFRPPQSGLSFIMELPRPLCLLCATCQDRKKVAELLPIRERNKIKACATAKTSLYFFCCFVICVSHPSAVPGSKNLRPFSAKTNPLPSEVPKGAVLLLCYCVISKNFRAIFNRPSTHFPSRGRSLFSRPRKIGLRPAKLVRRGWRRIGAFQPDRR